MREFVAILLIVVVIGVGLRMAGVPLPFIDYGPSIGEGGPVLPEVEVKPPGFDGFRAP